MSVIDRLRSDIPVATKLPDVLTEFIVDYLLQYFHHFLYDYVPFDDPVLISHRYSHAEYTIALQRHEMSGLWVSITEHTEVFEPVESATSGNKNRRATSKVLAKKSRTLNDTKYVLIHEIDPKPAPWIKGILTARASPYVGSIAQGLENQLLPAAIKAIAGRSSSHNKQDLPTMPGFPFD